MESPTRKEIVKRIIEDEGLEGLLRNPPFFLRDNYGNDEERRQAIALAGYGEGEAEALTIQEIIDDYEEMVREQITNESLLYYINVERMIRDDVSSGFLSYVVLPSGNVYFVREI